jgi:hypothetical protein
MPKFEKPRELRVSLRFSFALAKASQKRLESIRTDVLALRAGNEKGEYSATVIKVRASGKGSTEVCQKGCL